MGFHREILQDGPMRWRMWDHPHGHVMAWKPLAQRAEFLKPHIHEGDVVLDIGAFIGDTALPMAYRAGRTGLCVAFEPNPASFEVLCENGRLNRDTMNLWAVNAAAEESTGTATFHYCDDLHLNGGLLLSERERRVNHFAPLEVRLLDIRWFLRGLPKPISYIKIDTEGHDHRLLKLIFEVLDNRPVVEAEFFPDLTTQEKVAFFVWLVEMGYDVTFPETGRLHTVETVVNQPWMFDVLCIPKD